MLDEEILAKKGIELFKELLRVYPVADVEDYCKGGMWRDDTTLTDLQLIEAHRREAGAPDPIPLDEVVVPDVPKAPPGFQLGGVRPTLPGAMLGGLAKPGGLVAGKLPATTTAAAPAAAGALAELRLINLFVMKHKLQEAKTKMLLAKLDPPPRRRYVITNFAPPKGSTDPMAALEQYIAQCEKTNAWGGAAAMTTSTPTLPSIRPVVAKPLSVPASFSAGVKRPLMSPSLLDPSKRPRITAPFSAPGSVRPLAAGMVRPMLAKPGPLAKPGGLLRPVAPKAKAKTMAEKPGLLIRNLLERF